MSENFSSPPINRTMRVLDREYFQRRMNLCCVKFPDPRHISVFAKEFSDCILRVPRIPHVISLDKDVSASENSSSPISTSTEHSRKRHRTLACDNGIITKAVLLHHSIKTPEDANSKLTPKAQEFLRQTDAEILPHELILDYNFWKADEILRAVLPEEFLEEIPTGFTVTGHIAHLNLRKEFKPFAELIGQVILDKNPKIECVVDKVSTIATQFRTFPMKVIAGDPQNLIVEQRESNCTFKFDFSKVYWNSRLHTEHDRLVSKFFLPGQVVCDVFAGVGPFAVPAGKKKVIVLANDLNPESFKYLKDNIDLNKVSNFVRPFNLDGAEFISRSVPLLQQLIESQAGGVIRVPKKIKRSERANPNNQVEELVQIPRVVSHYVMNLPDSAIDFLGNFNGLYKGVSISPDIDMPWIHVHCFEKYEANDTISMPQLHERVYKRILTALDTTPETLPESELQYHLVRKVSPTKPMFCVSFKLPKDIGLGQ